MRAAVYTAPGDIATVDVPDPVPGTHDVLLRVAAVGICGSDLHVYRAGHYGARPGWIMGHEFVGEAVHVGADVEGIALGGRFTGFTIEFCGHCYWCRHGEQRLCSELFEHYSGYGAPGAMAEFIVIRNAVLGSNIFAVPDALSDIEAAMAEPLGTAMYAVRRSGARDGDTVAVLGVGVIGNLVVQALKTTLDVTVVATDVSPERLSLARECGADATIDAASPDAAARLSEAVGEGRYFFGESGMADVVINASGAPPTHPQSLDLVRAGGTVAIVGLSEAPTTLDMSLIAYKDIRLVGVIGSVIPKALALLARGGPRVERLVSHRLPLGDAARAFELAGQPSSMKVIMNP